MGKRRRLFLQRYKMEKTFQLEDVQGKYVLLDFWGSWCGPCRAESPAMVELYQKYQGKKFADADGFEIVSVAIERSEANWKRAIQSDNLFWPYHVLDMTTSMKFFNGQVSEQYGVKQIPTKFLLNPDGMIIGVNQSVNKIDRLLAKKVE